MPKHRKLDVAGVMKRIHVCMRKEDIRDVFFRHVVAATQFGDVGKYLTHDQGLNPGSRPHGTKKDEILAYGQALIQIIALADLRGIPLEGALEAGLSNWEQKDWRKKKTSEGLQNLSGYGAVCRKAGGIAYVVSEDHPPEKMPPGSILIVQSFDAKLVEFMGNVNAIITDQGGLTSHGAIVALDMNIPCFVGTGNATELIPHGAHVIVDIERFKASVAVEKAKK